MRGGLQDVARGAGAQRLEEELLVVVHREDQHPQVGALLGELARRLDARQPRHRDIEQGEVDLLGAAPAATASCAVAGLGDDLEVRLGVEDHAQAVTHERVVVGEQDRGCTARSAACTAAPRGGPACRGRRPAPDAQRRRRSTARARACRGPAAGAAVGRRSRRRRRRRPARRASPCARSASSMRVARGMADGVGQALLGDAVDDDLVVVAERRQVALQAADDLDAGALRHALATGSSARRRARACRAPRAAARGRAGGRRRRSQDAVADVADLVRAARPGARPSTGRPAGRARSASGRSGRAARRRRGGARPRAR